MSFLLADCKELDFGELLTVNGGSSFGGSCSGSGTSLGCSGNSGSYGGCGGSGTSSGGGVLMCGGSGPTGPITGHLYCSGGNDDKKQTPINNKDYHCDIIAFNTAVDQGVKNPGSWDGNYKTVDQIYKQNYKNMAKDSMNGKSKGYVFFDFDGNGTYDHMEYYEGNGNGTYTCWETDGIGNPYKKVYTWSKDKNGKGGANTSAVFVKLQ